MSSTRQARPTCTPSSSTAAWSSTTARRIDLDIAPARDAVAKSVEYVRSQLGEQAWEEGMHPVLEPEAEIENPYKYTEGTAKVKAQS